MLYNIRNDDDFKVNPVLSSKPKTGFRSESLLVSERGVVAAGEEAVNVGLGVPVFVAVAGVAEEAVVTEAFQIAVFYAEECHQGFVVVDAFFFWGGKMGVLGLHKSENLVEKGFNAVHL